MPVAFLLYGFLREKSLVQLSRLEKMAIDRRYIDCNGFGKRG
jgi:hypothetical protein